MIPSGLLIVADILLGCLLIIAIFYGLRVSRQLEALRADKAELNHVLKKFTLENERAEQAIARLQSNAEDGKKHLEKLISEGEPLKHELSTLIKNAEGYFKRLERKKRTVQAMAEQAPASYDRTSYEKAAELRMSTSPPPAPSANAPSFKTSKRENLIAQLENMQTHHSDAP